MSTPSPSSGDSEGQNLSGEPEQASWWCRILVKIVAVIAAITCTACSVTVFFTIHPLCIVAGIWMICISLVIILLEVPFCCQAFDVTKGLAKFTTQMKYWQKGLFYIIISIVPVAFCAGLFTALGCIIPFATGVIYGLMSLGKKASRGEMLASARKDSDMKNFTKFENEAE